MQEVVSEEEELEFSDAEQCVLPVVNEADIDQDEIKKSQNDKEVVDEERIIDHQYIQD